MGQITVSKCPIEGLYIIEPTVHGDNRGYFMETYNRKDMEEAGLNMVFVQDNQSMSTKGVLRGLHTQKKYPQGKLVRVIRGRVFDVAVDVRPGSETYGKWYGVELTEEFAAWGVPTCWSLLDAQQTLPQNALLLASGGIRSAGDAARAFALGADAVGITAPLLRLVMEQGIDAAADYVEALAEGLQKYMLLLGCLTPKELRDVPLIVTGETRDFIASRGYELAKLCRWRRG